MTTAADRPRIILLRAVNVGGTATLPMAELREIAVDVGATEVQTYIQSGNLVCVPPSDPEVFDRALEAAIETRFGFFREVISRSPRELHTALEMHPFEVIEPRFSYITFLATAPAADAVERAASYEIGNDRWQVIGREIHSRYAHGAGRPEMPAAKIGKALGVPGTARNWRTVNKLLDITR